MEHTLTPEPTDRTDDRQPEAQAVPKWTTAPSLSAAIEAILLVTDAPISVIDLATALDAPPDEVQQTITDLAADYDEAQRGFELRCVSGGWRYYTRESCAEVVGSFVIDGQSIRMTQASLETLAVVAYRQPVSRARVSAIRGVNVDGVVRTLLTRGLVEEVGHEPETGAILYGTSSYFLERMGMNSLDELAPLAPLVPDLSELEGLGEGEL